MLGEVLLDAVVGADGGTIVVYDSLLEISLLLRVEHLQRLMSVSMNFEIAQLGGKTTDHHGDNDQSSSESIPNP